jgi:hypothetical protein
MAAITAGASALILAGMQCWLAAATECCGWTKR